MSTQGTKKFIARWMSVVDVGGDQGVEGGGLYHGAWKNSCIRIRYRIPVFYAMYLQWVLSLQINKTSNTNAKVSVWW